jgi:leucine-rich repeat-containing G protein-coupled receptor 6
VTRGIGRCRHSSNFSNRQTPANTNSLNSGSGNSGNHSKNHNNNSGPLHCSCTAKKGINNKGATGKWWPFAKLKNLLCGLKEPEDLAAQNKWNNQVRGSKFFIKILQTFYTQNLDWLVSSYGVSVYLTIVYM